MHFTSCERSFLHYHLINSQRFRLYVLRHGTSISCAKYLETTRNILAQRWVHRLSLMNDYPTRSVYGEWKEHGLNSNKALFLVFIVRLLMLTCLDYFAPCWVESLFRFCCTAVGLLKSWDMELILYRQIQLVLNIDYGSILLNWNNYMYNIMGKYTNRCARTLVDQRS